VSRWTVRFRRDGDGFWYEVRDPHRRLVKTAWRHGSKRYAQDEARHAVYVERNKERQAV